MSKEKHLYYLEKAVSLAKLALDKGDEPFGSILVLDDKIVYEDHNRVSGGDHTNHPEFEIAKWAANNLTKEERKRAVCYTSGEHCPMCSAAHGWVGLGDIHYASSTKQLVSWLNEFNVKKSNVKPLEILEVIENVNVYGPYNEFYDTLREYHKINANKKK